VGASAQIIIQNVQAYAAGAFTVSGIFWLTAPANWSSVGSSALPNVSQSDAALLQQGLVVEQSFVTGEYPAGTTLGQVQADLIARYGAAQAALSAQNPPIAGLAGLVYNGSTWATPAAPSQVAAAVAQSSTAPIPQLGAAPDERVSARLGTISRQLYALQLLVANAFGCPTDLTIIKDE
jgi:hypothetical protein